MDTLLNQQVDLNLDLMKDNVLDMSQNGVIWRKKMGYQPTRTQVIKSEVASGMIDPTLQYFKAQRFSKRMQPRPLEMKIGVNTKENPDDDLYRHWAMNGGLIDSMAPGLVTMERMNPYTRAGFINDMGATATATHMMMEGSNRQLPLSALDVSAVEFDAIDEARDKFKRLSSSWALTQFDPEFVQKLKQQKLAKNIITEAYGGEEKADFEPETEAMLAQNSAGVHPSYWAAVSASRQNRQKKVNMVAAEVQTVPGSGVTAQASVQTAAVNTENVQQQRAFTTPRTTPGRLSAERLAQGQATLDQLQNRTATPARDVRRTPIRIEGHGVREFEANQQAIAAAMGSRVTSRGTSRAPSPEPEIAWLPDTTPQQGSRNTRRSSTILPPAETPRPQSNTTPSIYRSDYTRPLTGNDIFGNKDGDY